MSDSNISVAGNLTRDPELRFTTGGRAVATFGLAVNRRYQVNNEWQEQVSFFNVVAWGTLAENAAASLSKGARIIVSGRLEQRTWETDQGEKRSVVEIIADDLGPSLKWATAEVARVKRENGNQPPSHDDPVSAPAKSGGRAPDPVYGDQEQPF